MSASRATPLSPPERAAVEAALASERAANSARIAALTRDFEAIVEASALGVADDEQDPEGATIGFERAQVASLLDEARAHLERLDLAGERLATGDYGTCRSCGRVIALERLLASPTAQTCVQCAGGGGRFRRPGLGG